MGAKASDKLKLQRSDCKCDVCGRKFLNRPALVSHRKFVHKTETLPGKRVANKREAAPKPEKEVPVIPTKVSSRIELRKLSKMSAPKTVTKSVTKPVVKVDAVKKYIAKKIEFKCPKCVRVFSVYFSAYRHIQKYHCFDDNDDPVSPNSPALIKPIRIEQTSCCNEWVPTNDVHVCKSVTVQADNYMCLGCQQTFDSLLLFEHHVKALHPDVEQYFFPSNEEFTTWKSDLENVTNIKFVLLSTSQLLKQTYHCSHQPALKAEKTLFCPSSLIITEFKNGFLVLYYKEHFGHACNNLPKQKYKKYSINVDNDKSIQNINNDESVYQQFKNIINSIVANAAKADVAVLNNLLGTALEMTIMLNNSEIEQDVPITNKSMTEAQITDVLSEVKVYPGKRKVETVKNVKKQKLENDENSKNNNISKSKIKKHDLSTPVRPNFNQSPSFNDTYKDFVDQNFKSVQTDSSTPKRNSVKKKIVMKTKIGQFKVRESLSPKTPKESLSPDISPKPPKTPKESLLPDVSPKPPKTVFKIKPDIKYEVKEQENDCNILILKI